MAGAVSRSAGAALRLEGTGTELEEIEIRLLLDGIRLCYGYDFREYALSPLRRGLANAMARENVQSISAYQDRILHDASCMQRFLGLVGVNVTTMFRDPDLIRCLREEVVPLLRTYPSCRVWVAGCATGEEVYSLAVLLDEEGVLGRCTLYASTGCAGLRSPISSPADAAPSPITTPSADGARGSATICKGASPGPGTTWSPTDLSTTFISSSARTCSSISGRRFRSALTDCFMTA